MPLLSKLFKGGLKPARKQLPGLLKDTAQHEYPYESLEALRNDISNTMAIRGTEEAANIVPEGDLQDRIREIGGGTSRQQLAGGGIGALGGGLLGAGTGALAMGLSKGRSGAARGLLAGIPTAALGYGAGHHAVSRLQLLSALKDDLNPGAGIKRAKVEEGFGEILLQLKEAMQEGTLDLSQIKTAVSDLREGRGYGLDPSERHLIRRNILGRTVTKIHKYASSPEETTTSPPSNESQPAPFRTKSASMVLAGGQAALTTLGLAPRYTQKIRDFSD